MGNPSHEATGSRRAPLPDSLLSPAAAIKVKIVCVRDAMFRAVDALDSDLVDDCNWLYVATQLRKAAEFATEAHGIAAGHLPVTVPDPDDDWDEDEIFGLVPEIVADQVGALEGGGA